MWTISHATEGRFDVRITNGSSVRWHKYDTQEQIDTLEVANFRVRNPADTFDYDIVPGAITADRQLNLPVITGTDTLAVLGLAQTFTAVQSYGAGGVIRFSAGTAVTAAQYEIVRDVDATNQLHFNVPTGATYEWSTNDVSQMVFGAGILYLGDTANAQMTTGQTLNQVGADNEVWAVKSSDVTHGVTDLAEADTYGHALKTSATAGGLTFRGYSSGTTGLAISGIHTTDSTAKTTTASAAVHITASLRSGTSVAAIGADGNIVAIINNGTTRFIFDAEGSGHADIEWVAFDAYDDLALIHDVEQHLLDRESTAGTYSRHALEAAGIIGRDSWHFENGRPRAMVNMTKLAMLHHGALIQIGQRFDERDTEIAALRSEIAELRKALPAA